MNLARVLHGGSEFVFFGPPPRAGARLTTTSRLDKQYEKEGRRGGTMKFAETVQEFFDESGQARGRVAVNGDRNRQGAHGGSVMPALGRAPRRQRANPRQYGPLTKTDLVRYQGASGDFNPIHHDDDFAKSAGFPSVFSVGMLQAGILAGYVTDWLGAANVRRFSVQFREQLWPGDTLVCSAKVSRRYEDHGERKVDLELLCMRVETGGTAIKGEATFVVP